MYRQGDILIVKGEADKYALSESREEQNNIVTEGSITGHHHVIKNGKVYRKRRDWYGCIGYILAKEGCQLLHDEHATIDLPAGEYKIIKQREVTGDVED